jgi:hypothetical protein
MDIRSLAKPVMVKTQQPVEKVGIGPIATANRVPKAPKSAYLAPNLGQWRASREFFNRLASPYSIT